MSRNASEPQHDATNDADLVPEDDAIIGRAFYGSLAAMAVIAAVVAVVFLSTHETTPPNVVIDKTLGNVHERNETEVQFPAVRYTDITEAAGLNFVHVNGATGDKLLPETMGSGAAFFDYDNDGDQDLLLINAQPWSPSEQAAKPTLAFYQNDGSGQFTDHTQAAGLAISAYGTGVAVADFDNDGDTDLFIAALGHNLLLRNDSGVYRDITKDAGVAGGDSMWSTSAGFFDYDNDGDLDLFVCNYVVWSAQIDQALNFTMNGRDRAYGPPTNYAGTHSYLYRNNGDGRFSDVSEQAGIQVNNPATGAAMGKALAVSFVDLDQDGHIDIAVANDTVQNFLFHNAGDGRFDDVGMSSGFGFDSHGRATGAMGLDAAHFRDDDHIGIAIGNFANEMSSLYVTRANELQFSDEAISEGVGAPSRQHLSFGLVFLDYDLDGRLDLLQANGHLEDTINQVQSSQHYRQSAQMFWNAGADARMAYHEVPAENLGDLSKKVAGRALSYADIDGDGDLDVLITTPGDKPLLLRNDAQTEHNWLRLRLTGTSSNRDAIGAWIIARTADGEQRRQVMPTRSYLSQVERTVTLGLGKADQLEKLTVIWPDGSRQDVNVPTLNREIEITQP